MLRALTPDLIDRAVVEVHGFRFAEVDRLDHPSFLPGGAKYDDLPGMLAQAAPAPTLVLGESENSLRVAAEAYRRAGSESALWIIARTARPERRTALDWLLAD